MHPLEGKTCLVTGGAGFVGSHLVDALLVHGARVTVLDTAEALALRALPEGVVAHAGDIKNVDDVAPAMQGVAVAFHLAALTSVPGSVEHPREYHETNVNGTVTILEAARASSVHPRIVFASSAAIYGNQDIVPVHEDLPRRPLSPYALTKCIGEDMLALWHRLYHIETVSLRCFNIYGPRMNPDGPYASLIGRFLKLRTQGVPLSVTGDGEQTRDHIHVSDVVAGYLAAAVCGNVGRGEVLNLASGRGVTVNRVAELIGGLVDHVSERPGDLRHSVADISRTRALLAWEPQISLEEGIAELKHEHGIV